MMMIQENLHEARAFVKIKHEIPYLDPIRGWAKLLVSEEEIGNLITNGGRVAVHTYIYGTTAQRTSGGLSGTGLNYIALSNDGTSPADGDTSLTGELSADGLGRAQGTVTLPTGAETITTVEKEFTYTGTTQAVQKTALFDDSSGGKMAHEILFTQRTLNNGDTLTLTFSITLS